jgi:hypothetical protein
MSPEDAGAQGYMGEGTGRSSYEMTAVGPAAHDAVHDVVRLGSKEALSEEARQVKMLSCDMRRACRPLLRGSSNSCPGSYRRTVQLLAHNAVSFRAATQCCL